MRKGTNTGREWLMFLIDLEKSLEKYYDEDWKHLKKRIVFIFDNASIHLDDQIQRFFKK